MFADRFKAAVRRELFRQVKAYSDCCAAGQDVLSREIYLDMRFLMTDSVMTKVDRMSMASSLEIRVPLLDLVLVEYRTALPGDWKLKRMTTKYIFRAALAGLLPDKVVYRGKQGYSLPEKHLLRGELKSYMVGLLKDSRLLREQMNSRLKPVPSLIEFRDQAGEQQPEGEPTSLENRFSYNPHDWRSQRTMKIFAAVGRAGQSLKVSGGQVKTFPAVG